MTDIKVFKNNQVGGNVTMISTDKTKIVIDYGEDLPGKTTVEQFSIDWEKENVDAVFFTHYHGDHVGRLAEIPKNIPLYMSEASNKVLLNHYKKLQNKDCLNHLGNPESICYLEGRKTIIVGDIRITPHPVDHSAFDSFMFYVETPDKSILHTGDYRDQGHRGVKIVDGEKRSVIVDTIEHEIKKDGAKNIDVLITEGTMIGIDQSIRKYSEAEMQEDLTKIFRDHKYIFLVISSTNADSLLSFYRAATANKMGFYAKESVLDQLRVFGDYSREWEEPYDFSLTWPILKKNESERASSKYKRAFAGQRKHMREEGFVVIVSEKDEDLLKEFSDLDTMLIYSMWDGYIDEEIGGDAYSADLANFCLRHKAEKIHVGGHAYPGLISEVIKSANPIEEIIPIHTDNLIGFLDLPIGDDLRRKIRIC